MSQGARIIKLPTDDTRIYRQVLKILNFGMGLTPKEIDVLAEFVRLNNEYTALPAIQRAKFIFSTDMRKEVMEKLDIDESALNNILTRLRKEKTYFGKPILSKDNIIEEELLFSPSETGFNIAINLYKRND